MELRELIARIGQTYDRTLPMGSEAQTLLRQARNEFVQWLPAGYQAVGSGGKGNAAACPWIAVLDPDETISAQQGMYVAYLFAADMTTVIISLNQGVTEIGRRLGRLPARAALKTEAEAIRASFEPDSIADLATSIDLKSKADLPVDYEHGNIAARAYNLADLPSEQIMLGDLRRFVRIYALALEARAEGRQRGDDGIISTTPLPKARKQAGEFKPKSAADYRQMLNAREITKSRKHESLVNDYASFLNARGFVVASPHPRDMTADRDRAHWLIEAKTVSGNPEFAARDALAQLFFYARFLYEPGTNVNKLALFSEDIGDLYVTFFEELAVAVVWKDGTGWRGSPCAQEAELC